MTTTREFSVVSRAGVVPCRRFSANHFAGRFARFLPNSAVGSAFAGLCAENFLHKLLGMLNASLRSGFVIARASRARRTLCNRANIERIGKPYVMGVFERSEKFFARRCAVMLCSMSRSLRTLLESHAMVPTRAQTGLMLQKHWFFYHAVVIPMQCSRSPRARTTSPLTHG